jgi:hypothetical protein
MPMQGRIVDKATLIGVDMHQSHVDFVSTFHKLPPKLQTLLVFLQVSLSTSRVRTSDRWVAGNQAESYISRRVLW